MGRYKQHSLLLYNLQLSAGLVRMPHFHSISLIGGGYKPYFAHTITKMRKGELWKWEAKRDWNKRWGRLFWGQSTSLSWECLSNKKSVCLSWAELICNLLFHILRSIAPNICCDLWGIWKSFLCRKNPYKQNKAYTTALQCFNVWIKLS